VSPFPREEVEGAFRHLWRVGPVGEDWSSQAELYTEDCVYFDHFYGEMTRDTFRTWCTGLMTEQFPELYTAYEWHVVDGDRVVVLMQNRRDNPDPDGPPYFDFPGVSTFRYAGGGLWAEERDYWDLAQAKQTARLYRTACEKHDPAHPSSRSRRHWPADPGWAHP
jgi:ketosteroid isomerase-like protein